MTTSYKESGVDPKRADKILETIGTSGAAKFAAILDLDTELTISDSVPTPRNIPWRTKVKMVMGADGVGTKVEVARALGKYDTLGIDLVAMCVNDILCHGALPSAFLDYYATSELDVEQGKAILTGIKDACDIAGCNLVGGETAEMPGVYKKGRFDLAGFCVGLVHENNLLPRGICPGDVIIGLRSNGLHSNGFSLVRKLYHDNNLPFTEDLLTPTRIYCNDVHAATGCIKGIAHITGGGIHGNLPRCLPEGTSYSIVIPEYPNVFKHLQQLSGLSKYEMECTFNCGWGMMIVVDPARVSEVLSRTVASRVLGVIT